MGIIRTARDDVAASIAAFKTATTPNRAQLRRYVAAIVDAGNEWLRKRDAQDGAAPADFAASRQAQFNAFVAEIPDPILDPVDPAS
jgi:hypothetical protein